MGQLELPRETEARIHTIEKGGGVLKSSLMIKEAEEATTPASQRNTEMS